MVSTALSEEAVRLEVADTGKSISPEMLEEIFRLHYSTRKSGSGIGPSVALLDAESHGGDLIAESTARRGTTFTLVLPRAPDQFVGGGCTLVRTPASGAP